MTMPRSQTRVPTYALEAAWAARLVAQLARGCRKTQHALERLAKLWSPPEPHSCFRPSRHLHQVIPSERDIEVVARYTREERLQVRLAALRALGWASQHETARRVLLEALDDEARSLRRIALYGILRIGTEPVVVAALRRMLVDPVYVHRWQAAQALAGTPYRNEARAALLAAPPRGIRYMTTWLEACAVFGRETLEKALPFSERALAEARPSEPLDTWEHARLVEALRGRMS
ncbi:HEAT repeat domain-containing protein [Polyangium mundeleinium]|uniref:HEAT repeat domain-containing protein n=1 Tax=Polyangium mundeleinium TaxID=2995306 RepID=A0ABT5FA42_9BACT|nr:HEAT repeat domain-containing protein [Polyangium mundeleinium]MDC0749980.1 HEAT repeat domain-containing protein [Polyangium mundeleinium]